jgi:protein-tyrosine-phosphatase
VNIRDHVSAALVPEMVQRADFVFAMTRAHRDRVVEMVPRAAGYASLLLDEEEVQDPMGGERAAYEACADRIEQGLKRRLAEVPV